MPEAQPDVCPGPVPPRSTAIGFALIAACSAAFISAMMHRRVDPWSDFSQLVVGGRALWQGGNPYLAVSSPRTGLPLVYPLPALLLAWPLSWLPMAAADACFSALGVGVFAFAHARTGPIDRPAVVAFFSAALAQTVIYSQWSALLLGAVLLSNGWLGGAVLACKPTTAIWLWAARPSWRLIVGALTVSAISLAVRPTWPLEWWTATSHVRPSTVIPALLPFGFVIVIAAAMRWRRPEARLLLAMCCVPHTTLMYETLPLLAMVPATWGEAWLLCASSWACLTTFTTFVPDTTPINQALHLGGLWSLVGIYTPCAILVWRRENA